MKNLDCRALSCPGPVIQVKKVLEQTPGSASFSVDVSTEASMDNVRRFAQSRGAAVTVQEGPEGAIRLIITTPADTQKRGRGDAEGSPGPKSVPLAATQGPEPVEGSDGRNILETARPPVIFITGETLGTGDDKLGTILMEGFVNTLLEQDRIPDQILFMNTGVKLAVQGSPVVNTLQKLADRGCEILVCGTCLEFYSLTDRLIVGTVSNMFEIQRALLETDSAIKI